LAGHREREPDESNLDNERHGDSRSDELPGDDSKHDLFFIFDILHSKHLVYEHDFGFGLRDFANEQLDEYY
jgi:hypothetical protein